MLRKARLSVGPVIICSRSHPFQFQGGLTSGRLLVLKIVAESLSLHDLKHVVPTLLSGISVRKIRDLNQV
jgi:hypothetical protein